MRYGDDAPKRTDAPEDYGRLEISSPTVYQTPDEGGGIEPVALLYDGGFMLSIVRHNAPWYKYNNDEPHLLSALPRDVNDNEKYIVRELPVGTYTLTLTSENTTRTTFPAWETPTYSGSANFSISTGDNLVNVICRQSNLKATVRFSDGLWAEIDHSQPVSVTVAVNNPTNGGRSLVFDKVDLRGGYFAVAAGDTMTVTLNCTTTSGVSGPFDETVTGLAPGQWQRVYLTMDDSEYPIMLVEGSEAGQIVDGGSWW
jgi:hypothetical protein